MTFKALLATRDGEKISTDLVELEEKDLMSGDVTIAVDYSTVNYKDGMAPTGRAPIIRTFPLIPGIDLSGPDVARRIVEAKTRGRVVVDVNL
jgi:acrylyl-CoA reductase (NADPH)